MENDNHKEWVKINFTDNNQLVVNGYLKGAVIANRFRYLNYIVNDEKWWIVQEQIDVR